MFIDRSDAGKKLALLLAEYKNDQEAIVIALPRGGVVLGFEVAQALSLPLDIVTPRKIGAPHNPELAIGAVTESGESILSTELIQRLNISEKELASLMEKEKKEASFRSKRFRKNRPPRNLKNKKVIIVDDGLATGSTMRAAIKTVKKEGAKKIIVAIPVSPSDTWQKIKKEVDQIVSITIPSHFMAVSQFYQSFNQTSDEEVILLLEKSCEPTGR